LPVAGNESLVYYFKLESKKQSSEFYHKGLPAPEKFKTTFTGRGFHACWYHHVGTLKKINLS
jgi:hypothetical protein